MNFRVIKDLSEFWNLDKGTLKSVPVIMCIWKRQENLPRTIELLKKQKNQNFDLFLWNNNQDIKVSLDGTLNNLPTTFNKYLYTHEENIGGYGRFYLARALNKLKHYKYAIFIDDDETFNESMVDDFLSEAEPEKMTSIWGHQLVKGQNYQVRRHARFGQDCQYCGTGGMVVDISIFSDNKVFDCPKKYWFIEDLWLSYVGHTKGWKLKGSKAKVVPRHNDGKDMTVWHSGIASLKIEMLEYLRKEGWDV
jgi:glycosyltransferase involved in cell wall biosynthesis